jgi:hypothetical protein
METHGREDRERALFHAWHDLRVAVGDARELQDALSRIRPTVRERRLRPPLPEEWAVRRELGRTLSRAGRLVDRLHRLEELPLGPR